MHLFLQVVYHSSAYLDLCRDGVIEFGEPIDVCIPTGNFGNAMSALYAKQMGVPVRKIICASNHNRIITDFITTGEYDLRGRPLLPSLSPAIDILKPSNLERFIYHVSDGSSRLVNNLFKCLDTHKHFQLPKHLLGRMQQEVQAGWCSEDNCLAAIHDVHTQTGYLMDTHTAVAKVVADQLQDDSCPMVLCSTAHHAKFPPAVFKALRTQDVPQDPMQQLEKLETTASRPEGHKETLRCLRERDRTGHTVCPSDYRLLVDEVERMIHDSFFKIT